MQPTLAELEKTSLFRQAAAEVHEARRKAEMEASATMAETARIRAEQGKYLSEQYKEAVEKYETMRKELHAQVRVVWECAQHYSRATGVLPNTFPLNTFNQIHLPTLDGSDYNSGFSSTRGSTMAWMASSGKAW